MENVKTSVPNKIVGDNGSSYDSIRKMAKVLHVDRKRIRRNINDKGYFRYGMKLEESIDKIKTAWTPYTGSYLIPLPKSPGSDDLSSIYRRIRAALNHRLYFVFYDGLTIPYDKNITNYGVLTLNSNLLDRNLSSTISTDNTNTVKLTINLSTSDYYYGIQNDSLSINKWGNSVPLPKGILVEL